MGDYFINGVEILTPSEMRWLPRRSLDVSGEGRDIYPGVYQARLTWRLMSLDEFDIVRGQWQSVSSTGTAVVSLPDINASTWVFKEFSGTHLQEPRVGAYFQQHVENVVLVVTNIVLE